LVSPLHWGEKSNHAKKPVWFDDMGQFFYHYIKKEKEKKQRTK
jgi:hypothetical protein